MSKVAVDVSSIVLTADVPNIGLGINPDGAVVSIQGEIAIGVSAQTGVVGDTIRIDHGPLLEALSGASIPIGTVALMWNATGKLIPYVAGSGVHSAGLLAPNSSATGANQWVRFYPHEFSGAVAAAPSPTP